MAHGAGFAADATEMFRLQLSGGHQQPIDDQYILYVRGKPARDGRRSCTSPLAPADCRGAGRTPPPGRPPAVLAASVPDIIAAG
jgi:hypothetical protein